MKANLSSVRRDKAPGPSQFPSAPPRRPYPRCHLAASSFGLCEQGPLLMSKHALPLHRQSCHRRSGQLRKPLQPTLEHQSSEGEINFVCDTPGVDGSILGAERFSQVTDNLAHTWATSASVNVQPAWLAAGAARRGRWSSALGLACGPSCTPSAGIPIGVGLHGHMVELDSIANDD